MTPGEEGEARTFLYKGEKRFGRGNRGAALRWAEANHAVTMRCIVTIAAVMNLGGSLPLILHKVSWLNWKSITRKKVNG